ncbi:hypothetical protein J3R30DRAFT_3404819 [Lentinula aciculospora]|uniref:Aminoglycoside phosphotransferase domain-containing protein n=1 Tax=Lentinula aciculospora TaxID=153920 RepID=A0A9W9A9D8_9AGAR|nr:hypothetical protein J3R30DRAFT_3404819 [Lentinula aciculospora]
MLNKPRSRSAPPFSAHDLGRGWQLREDGLEEQDLQMAPADLAEFSSIEILRNLQARAMFWVDDDKVLKLFSYLIDVSVIVANMELAGTRIPVPRVLRYGQSGNCAYILMERLPHPNLAVAMHRWGLKFMPWQLTQTVNYIVRELARLGLSHNDLVPRNVLVDNKGIIVSIIDWDTCTPLYTGGEYARRIRQSNHRFMTVGEEDWYHVFLRHSADRTGEEISIGCSRRHLKLFLHSPLVKSKAYQLVSAPITDPRNQSFSNQQRRHLEAERITYSSDFGTSVDVNHIFGAGFYIVHGAHVVSVVGVTIASTDEDRYIVEEMDNIERVVTDWCMSQYYTSSLKSKKHPSPSDSTRFSMVVDSKAVDIILPQLPLPLKASLASELGERHTPIVDTAVAALLIQASNNNFGISYCEGLHDYTEANNSSALKNPDGSPRIEILRLTSRAKATIILIDPSKAIHVVSVSDCDVSLKLLVSRKSVLGSVTSESGTIRRILAKLSTHGHGLAFNQLLQSVLPVDHRLIDYNIPKIKHNSSGSISCEAIPHSMLGRSS